MLASGLSVLYLPSQQALFRLFGGRTDAPVNRFVVGSSPTRGVCSRPVSTRFTDFVRNLLSTNVLLLNFAVRITVTNQPASWSSQKRRRSPPSDTQNYRPAQNPPRSLVNRVKARHR